MKKYSMLKWEEEKVARFEIKLKLEVNGKLFRIIIEIIKSRIQFIDKQKKK